MCNHHRNKNLKNGRLGSALEDGKAHQKDHKVWTRRDFLTSLGIAGGMGMVLQNLPVKAWATSPMGYALSGAESDRILVLIRLKGGNDGMNMVIPAYDYGTYSALRPNIAIAQNDLLDLGEGSALPNTMGDLMGLWNGGNMKVVQNVGYPDPNLSHFRSNDIWSSAADSDTINNTGWLGRFLENEFPDYLLEPPSVPPAIQIGGQGSLIFNSGTAPMSLVMNSPEELFEVAENGELYDTTNLPDCDYGEILGYVRSVTNSTYIYAQVIKEAYDASTTQANYTTSLGDQLALVARLIKGNLETKIYMVELDGFDTHAVQSGTHPLLMNNLAKAVSDFYEDLGAANLSENVLAMTFSEFGRRVEQNASQGTDHGTAAPLLLFGGQLNGGGFEGTPANLQDLDQFGNLQFSTDFRSIYATVLENWLCVNGNLVDELLGQNFERMSNLVVACDASNVGIASAAQQKITHKIIYGQGQTQLHFTLPQSSPVVVQLYSLSGQLVATVHKGTFSAGSHQLVLNGRAYQVAGQYIYRIQALGRGFSGKVLLV